MDKKTRHPRVEINSGVLSAGCFITRTHAKRAARWGLTVLFVALIGCAGIGRQFEPPSVNLVNIAVQDVKALETVFQIDMRIINPNDQELLIKGINCDLEINGKKLATGVAGEQTTVPAYGTAIVPILVYSSVIDMLRGIFNLQDVEKLQYQIEGKIRIGGGALLPSVVPFKSQGELSIQSFSQGEE